MELRDQLQQTVAACLRRHAIGGAGAPVLLALSGGRDSTALAAVASALARGGALPGGLAAAHVDHRIHPRSRAAAACVATLCRRLEVPLTVIALRGVAADEAALRQARYHALRRVAHERGACAVLTAHHADDDLETLLFRLLRGTGIRGLCGIPELRRLDEDLPVVRPLLGVRAVALHELVGQLQLPWLEDPTNQDLRYARNALRHSLMPRLRQQLGAGFDRSLQTILRQARARYSELQGHAATLLEQQARFPTPWRAELRLPPALDPQVLQEACCAVHERLHSSGRRPEWSWVERATALRGEAAGQRVDGPGRVLVERTREGLLFLDPGEAGVAPPTALPLAEGDPTRFGSTEWSVTVRRVATHAVDPAAGRRDRDTAWLDPSSAPGPWRVRAAKPGDRFWPLGAPGPVELRRFFQARYVPRFDRVRLPLVVDRDDRILWVSGVEIGHPHRATAASRELRELHLAVG